MSPESFAVQIGCIIPIFMILVTWMRESYFGYDREKEKIFACSVLSVAVLGIVYVASAESYAGRPVGEAALIVSSVAAAVSGVLWMSVTGKFVGSGVTESTAVKAAAVALTVAAGAVCVVADVSESVFVTAAVAASMIPYVLMFSVSVVGAIRRKACWEEHEFVSVALVSVPAIFCLALMFLLRDFNVMVLCTVSVATATFVYENHRESVTDPLTRVYNEAAISKYIETNIAKGKTVTAALFQIGGNDLVNIEFGHIEGDRVLTDTADCLKKASAKKGLFLGHFKNSKYYAVSLDGEENLKKMCDEMLPLIEELTSDRPYSLQPLAGITGVDASDNLNDVSRNAKENIYYNYRRDKQ